MIKITEASRPTKKYTWRGFLMFHYYTMLEVQLANTSHVANNYFASVMTPHGDVASHNSGKHIISASNYSDGFNYACYNSENYM